ncbi:hypothetical protein IF1G_11145 [Cordyceps javanica]|uniref:Uncharacterized protein n=1 Tax=Cordyceps javanica TaxID=43265 RepID=A0A545UL61_9HYPO|nr:hypothetical protein IF1G_11145 [Cordyceps javanica]TQW01491.1 hypothetical protein IF2G_10982 [Cordyceps javanica]
MLSRSSRARLDTWWTSLLEQATQLLYDPGLILQRNASITHNDFIIGFERFHKTSWNPASNEARARKPELLVTELAKELFSLSLYSVLEQSHPVEEYCFRPESYVSRAVIAGKTIVGADDGGLCKKRFQSSSWTTVHPSLIMGECNPASQNLFYDDRTEKHFPVLTIKALAQIVGEAVTRWKQQSTTERFRDGVYSYMCNGTSIRFFHLDFGTRYDDYLDAPTENAQLDLVRDHPEDTCIRISKEGHEAEPRSEATPGSEIETSRTSSESDYSVEM